ncbi:MAG: tetratricopeptide repeat protein [Gammaproteobacteria bacterium]
MRRAIAIDERSFGPDHPNVARDLCDLAHLLHATNRLQEAEPLINRALAINEHGYGPVHPNVALCLNNLAMLLQDTNRLPEAESLSRRQLGILLDFTRRTGHPHPRLDAALANYKAILRHRGQSEAEIEADIRPYKNDRRNRRRTEIHPRISGRRLSTGCPGERGPASPQDPLNSGVDPARHGPHALRDPGGIRGTPCYHRRTTISGIDRRTTAEVLRRAHGTLSEAAVDARYLRRKCRTTPLEQFLIHMQSQSAANARVSPSPAQRGRARVGARRVRRRRGLVSG